jgi:hypothetical protein
VVYAISLRNSDSYRKLVRISASGRQIGDFEIFPYSVALIERPVDQQAYLTAFRPSRNLDAANAEVRLRGLLEFEVYRESNEPPRQGAALIADSKSPAGGRGVLLSGQTSEADIGVSGYSNQQYAHGKPFYGIQIIETLRYRIVFVSPEDTMPPLSDEAAGRLPHV